MAGTFTQPMPLRARGPVAGPAIRVAILMALWQSSAGMAVGQPANERATPTSAPTEPPDRAASGGDTDAADPLAPRRVDLDDAVRWVVGLILAMAGTLLLVGLIRAFYWAPRAMLQRFETSAPPRSAVRESDVADAPRVELERPGRPNRESFTVVEEPSLADDADFPV